MCMCVYYYSIHNNSYIILLPQHRSFIYIYYIVIITMLHKFLITLCVFFIIILKEMQSIRGDVVTYDLHAYYFDAAPDGVIKNVLGVNGQFPGPTIRAKRGDTLIIRITNSIQDKDGLSFPTSVHWHGLEMVGIPWWDGPEGVTQCPIPYGSSMEYQFKLTQSGTYWYHSHHGWQFIEGFWGLLIIDNTPEIYVYDDEILISLTDWYHTPAKILTKKFLRGEIPTPIPDSGLINGRGTYPCNETEANGLKCEPTHQSPALLIVVPKKKYRIRVVNTSARSNFNFSIDGHKLYGIEVDGVDTIIVGPVDSVVVWPAQRYSFLVEMFGNLNEYWIRADMRFLVDLNTHPKAILQYGHEFFSSNISTPNISEVGTVTGTQGRTQKHSAYLKEIKNEAKAQQISSWFDTKNLDRNVVFPLNPPIIDLTKGRVADKKHRLIMTNVSRPTTIQNKIPIFLNPNLCRPIGIILSSAPNFYDQSIVLNVTVVNDTNGIHGLINGGSYRTSGVPVIFKLTNNQTVNPTSNPIYTPRLGSVIQLVINNQNIRSHPWHLHGHTFWVLGHGEPGNVNNTYDYDEKRDGKKLNINGVRRDTTHTFAYSWVVIRYIADNPGAWLFHCHVNWHFEVGHGAVFIEDEKYIREEYSQNIPDEARRVCKLNNIEIG